MMSAEPMSASEADHLVLRLEGFEGPLDLLLDLARAQKVDLAKISILALVEQYLAVIEGARRVRLELAADWLVMAAWLAWLKSRLLLPEGADAEEGEQAAEVLAARLRDLSAMRAGAVWLSGRPQLGREVFARGAPEDHTEIDRSRLALDLGSLVRAYLLAMRRRGRRAALSTAPGHPVERQGSAAAAWHAARQPARLDQPGAVPAGGSRRPLERRAALASTLLAGLEMARGGAVRLRQEHAFGPILVRRALGGVEEGA